MARAPSVGPAAAPALPTVPQIPRASPRLDGGNSGRIRATAVEYSNAAPAPWTRRAVISSAGLGAAAVRVEAATKMAMPTENMRRRPWRSARRPATSSRAAAQMA
jgi:hypothetical protein